MLYGDKNYGKYKAWKEGGAVFTIWNRLAGKRLCWEGGTEWEFQSECDITTYRHLRFNMLILMSLFSPLKLVFSVLCIVVNGTAIYQLLKLES